MWPARAGKGLALSGAYEVIILDLLLPGKDGLEVLRSLRDRGIKSKVLILTARDAVEDKVKGLDAGADDYLTKPFALAELLARVRTLLRREGEKGSMLKVADLEMDTFSRQVRRAGREISLTNKEYALLEYFLRNVNRVLSRTRIAEQVWDYDFGGTSNIVDVYVRYLRRKIDEGFPPSCFTPSGV